MKLNLTHLSKAAFQSFIGTLVLVLAEVIIYLTLVFKGIVTPQIMNGSVGFFTVGVVNALCCLFIVKHSPVSILFVPLVMNSFILVMAYLNAALDPWWVPVASAWILCLMASIIGILIRRKILISHNHLERA